MAKRPNAFNTFMHDAEKRQEEQQQIEAQLTGSETKGSTRKERMNITLPSSYKKRLIAAAREKSLSASVLIQMWIDEHCK